MATIPAQKPGETTAAYIQRLQATIAAGPDPRSLSVRISGKGAVSVYGLKAQFPDTNYADGWTRLADFMPTILEFIAKNRKYLAVKGQDFVMPPKTAETLAIFAKSAWGDAE